MIEKPALFFLFLAATVLSAGAPASADVFSIKAGAAYFFPAEASVKRIYGNGTDWNAEANIGIFPFLDLWMFGDGYDKKGRLPVTGESTEMRLTTFGGGLKFRVHTGPLRFYAGAGAAACAYREANVIGLAEGTKIGVIGQAGFYMPIVSGLLIDFAADYASIKVKPASLSADVGGARLAVRLGYVF